MKVDLTVTPEKNAEYQVISLEQLFDKVRDSKDIYEDVSILSKILLEDEKSSNPLVTSSPTRDVEDDIEIIKSRLECKIGLKSPIKIVFKYIERKYLVEKFSRYREKTLWTVFVDIKNICSQDDLSTKLAAQKAMELENQDKTKAKTD